MKLVLVYIVALSLSACSSEEIQTKDANDASPPMETAIDHFFEHYNNSTLANAVPDIDEEQAYEWADKFVEKLIPYYGEPIGYKGAFFKSHFKKVGLTGPASGIMLAKGMYESGVTVKLKGFNTGFIDSDLLVSVKDDKINDAQTDLEILASLEGVLPFIELIDTVIKLENRNVSSVLITNLGWRAGVKAKIIPVDATDEWVSRLQNFSFVLKDGKGKTYGEGSIKETYNIFENIKMLRDSLHKRGKLLKKGDLLSLGNVGFMLPLKFSPLMADRTIFKENTAILTYKNLDPSGPVQVIVHFDRAD